MKNALSLPRNVFFRYSLTKKYNYEKETDCAAYDIHYNSPEYYASTVPKKVFDQALQASGIPSTIFLSKNPSDKSLVVELRSIVKQKMSGFNRRNSSKS